MRNWEIPDHKQKLVNKFRNKLHLNYFELMFNYFKLCLTLRRIKISQKLFHEFQQESKHLCTEKEF